MTLTIKMPPKRKVSPSNDFLSLSKRLDELERALQFKEHEINELKHLQKQTNDSFIEKFMRQDAIIAELRANLEQDPSLADNPEPESQPIAEHDLLVIGDSIVRDVSGSVINPGGDTTVKCLPGARPDDVVAEFRKMSSAHSYKRIVVHVGTNLIPKFSPAYTADKIVQCMETIRELAPTSKIAFSHILPKESNRLLTGINFINYRVLSSGRTGPTRTRFGNTGHSVHFCNSFGQVDTRLFKKDGTHLSDLGVKKFNDSLKLLISKN